MSLAERVGHGYSMDGVSGKKPLDSASSAIEADIIRFTSVAHLTIFLSRPLAILPSISWWVASS